jgi:hypothetical protein
MTRRLPSRRGYALLMVLMFNVLFLLLLGVAWRRIASVVRVATVRTQQAECDEGSLRVLANAMRLLETGLPPTTTDEPDSYEAGAILNVATAGEVRYFNVTFERDTSRAPTEEVWSVTVTRTAVMPTVLLPAYFPTASDP